MNAWQPRQYSPAKMAETVLLPAVAVLVHGWFTDTVTTQSSYPWLWLVPLLVALRYGFTPGLVAGLSLILTSLGAEQLFPASPSMPVPDIVGGLIATLVAGQYATYWRERLHQAELRVAYSDSRLESVTRAFYVTRISHDRLEEALIANPTSLRGALETLSAGLRQQEAGVQAFSGNAGSQLLQLVAHYCRIDEAGLFLFRNHRIESTASAYLGRPFELDLTDPLVSLALERKEATYFSIDQIIDDEGGDYRLVIPIITASDLRIGLLVVSDMPLLALEEENILTAAAILEYVADQVLANRESAELLRAFPECPLAFAHELLRVGHMERHLGVESTLVLWYADPAASTRLHDLLTVVHRGLDQYWFDPAGDDHPGILTLLPFSGPVAAQGFVQRIEQICHQRLGNSPEALGWHHRLIPLKDQHPETLLAGIRADLRAPTEALQ